MAGQLTGLTRLTRLTGPGEQTGPDLQGPQGFTLIELLVVITLLSIVSVSSALLVTTRGGGPNGPGSDATSFRTTHDQMRSLAIHGQVLRGIYITPTGRRMAEQRDGAWRMTGPTLRWRGQTRLGDASRSAQDPQIIFYPNGETTAFTVQFTSGNVKTQCHSDGWTGLQCAAR